MAEPLIISLISGALLAAIVIAFIFSPSFRSDILAGDGKTELFGLLSVQGAIVIVLTGIFMGGLLLPLSRLGPSKALIDAQKEIEILKSKLNEKAQEAMLLRNDLENPSTDVIKLYIERYMIARSLLRAVQLDDDRVPRGRASLIQMRDNKWANGTVLRVAFLDGNTDLHRLVEAAATEWVQGTGLKFEFGAEPENAEVRVTFNEGNWSYMGRGILNVGPTMPTMSIERSPGLADEDYKASAMMLFGHVLGFDKEYKKANAEIPWDRDAVYQYFSQFEWSKEQVDATIFKRDQMATDGSEFDPTSIMMPYFPIELFQGDFELRRNLTLSTADKERVLRYYPPPEDQNRELRTLESRPLSIAPGGQSDLPIRPSETRKYEIRTFGASNTLLELFENDGASMRFLVGDDDSGELGNARLEVKLFKSREYILRVRLFHEDRAGETAVMIW